MNTLKLNVFVCFRCISSIYVCTICAKKFSTKSNINCHMKNVHNSFQNMKKPTVKCPLCQDQFVSYSELDGHLCSAHDISVKKDTKVFCSYNSFRSWKLEFEKATVSSFIFLYSKKCKNGKITKYVCHRSGSYAPNLKNVSRQRQIKLKGTNKIGSNCPARITATNMDNGNITTEYVSTHLGHDVEVGRLRLALNDREDVAGKLFQGIPNHRILQDIGKKFDPTTRISYTTNHDLHNIQKAFNVQSNIIFHDDDTKSVNILIDKLQSKENNPILMYKPYGLEEPVIGTNNFFLVFMNFAQEEMLNKYGNDILMIDSTHGTNPYKIQLTTLMVVDDNHEGFPVAFLWSITQTEAIYSQFFSCIKQKVPNLKPKTFISDDSNTFYNAFVSTFNNTPYKILCDWHVKRNLTENLSKISNVEKRKDVKRTLKIVINELDVVTFQEMLTTLVKDLIEDPETKKYGEYFLNHYVKRSNQWAHCFRKGLHKNTNMSLEKWHHDLKHNSVMNGKCQRRLDISINNVIECLRMKFLKRLVSISRNKVPFKLSELRRRHKLAEAFANDAQLFEETPNSKWLVSSSKNKSYKSLLEYYEVKLEKADACGCVFTCTDCESCLHMFSCTCHDFTIQYNMCKHIHMVCKKFPRTQASTDKQDSGSKEDTSEDTLHFQDNDAKDEEHQFISIHLQQLASPKGLETEKKIALEQLDVVRALVTNSENSEAISYAKNNFSSIISSFHTIGAAASTSAMVPTDQFQHNKKLEHQNRRLPSLKRVKRKGRKRQASPEKSVEIAMCDLVFKN